MAIRAFIVGALCAILPGCSAPSDPLTLFKQLTEHGVKRVQEDTGKVWLRQAKPADSVSEGWVKIRHELGEFSYDVTKTDSLVSPYIAKLTVKEKDRYTEDFKSKSEAEASREFPVVLPEYRWEFAYAFQDSKWVLESSRCYLPFGDISLDIVPGEDVPDQEEMGRFASFFKPQK